MSFIRVDLEICLFSACFPNGRNHAFRPFRRDNSILCSSKGIDWNFGQVGCPFCEIRRHIFRTSMPNPSNDRCNCGEVLWVMSPPCPRPITAHAVAGKINSLAVNRKVRLQILEKQVEIFGKPSRMLSFRRPLQTLRRNDDAWPFIKLPDAFPNFHRLPLDPVYIISNTTGTVEEYQQGHVRA